MNEVEAGAALRAMISGDHWRMQVLQAMQSLAIPDCWIGAGFVRAMAWDQLHGQPESSPLDDVDVVFFDAGNPSKNRERALQEQLSNIMAGVPWSVKNQARMHLRNGDGAYGDTEDGLRHWLETPTAVAVRLGKHDQLDLIAPFGLHDLMHMILQPTPKARATARRRQEYRDRLRRKPWLRQWPKVTVIW